MVRWLRARYGQDVYIDSMMGDEDKITSALSVAMREVESEILQDGNANWKQLLKQTGGKGEDLLDKLLDVFEAADMRPEVRDELWSGVAINVSVNLNKHTALNTVPFNI